MRYILNETMNPPNNLPNWWTVLSFSIPFDWIDFSPSYFKFKFLVPHPSRIWSAGIWVFYSTRLYSILIVYIDFILKAYVYPVKVLKRNWIYGLISRITFLIICSGFVEKSFFFAFRTSFLWILHLKWK